jgi:hypothetical protein
MNVVSVVLPAGRFTSVARMVAAGFLSPSELGFDTVDDLQLAIEVILRSMRVSGDEVTVTLARGADSYTVEIGAFDARTLQRDLESRSVQGIALGMFLARLVKRVEVVHRARDPQEDSRFLVLHVRVGESA